MAPRRQARGSRFLVDPTWTPATRARSHVHTARVDPLDVLLDVLTLLANREPPTTVECCLACGCLCRSDEVCPGCRADREARRRTA